MSLPPIFVVLNKFWPIIGLVRRNVLEIGLLELLYDKALLKEFGFEPNQTQKLSSQFEGWPLHQYTLFWLFWLY